MKYMRIRPDWHRLDTPLGTFFGTSRRQVEAKARHSAGIKATQAAATRFRTNDRPDLADRGVVIVNCANEPAGWMDKLRDPGSWIPGTCAVDVHGSVWLNLGGDDGTGGVEWSLLHDAFNHLPECMREYARQEQAAALTFTDARDRRVAQC